MDFEKFLSYRQGGAGRGKIGELPVWKSKIQSFFRVILSISYFWSCFSTLVVMHTLHTCFSEGIALELYRSCYATAWATKRVGG